MSYPNSIAEMLTAIRAVDPRKAERYVPFTEWLQTIVGVQVSR